MSDEEFLTSIKRNYLLLKIKLYFIYLFILFCGDGVSRLSAGVDHPVLGHQILLTGDNTRSIRRAWSYPPAGLRLGRDHYGNQRRNSLYKTLLFFHEFFCSGRNPHPGQLGKGRGVTAGKPMQFLSQFNSQPGVILTKFCEQQLDL